MITCYSSRPEPCTAEATHRLSWTRNKEYKLSDLRPNDYTYACEEHKDAMARKIAICLAWRNEVTITDMRAEKILDRLTEEGKIMDPNAALKEIRDLYRRILDEKGDEHDALRLAELIQAVDERASSGASMPDAWDPRPF